MFQLLWQQGKEKCGDLHGHQSKRTAICPPTSRIGPFVRLAWAQIHTSVQPASETPRHFQGKLSHKAIISHLNWVLHFVLKGRDSLLCPKQTHTHRTAVCGHCGFPSKGGVGAHSGETHGLWLSLQPLWGAWGEGGKLVRDVFLAYPGNPRERGECRIRERFIRNGEKSGNLIFAHSGKMGVILFHCRSLPP